jgi:hypothetical protein
MNVPRRANVHKIWGFPRQNAEPVQHIFRTIKKHRKGGRQMAEFTTASANLRIVNDDGRSVFSAANVSPTVSADTASGFVGAVEKLHNNGSCSARLNIVLNLKR